MAVIILKYITFWYGAGLIRLFKYFKAYIQILADTFSVKISLTTFFSPWKRDVLTLQGLPLDQKDKAVIFNLISRFFGAFVKTVTLTLFLALCLALIAIEAAVFVLWIIAPLLPFSALFFLSLSI